MKNLSFNQKLNTYSTIATGVLLAASANGQIVYHDIVPDSILEVPTIPATGNSFQFDLNNDTKVDINFFGLRFSSSSSYSAWGFFALYAGSFVTGSNSYINALPLNHTISKTLSSGNDWRSKGTFASKSIYYSNTYTYGNWANQNDKYLGLRFETTSNDTLYGWMRLSVNQNCDSLIVKDYAYNSTPNQSILAGQTVSIVENNIDLGKVFYNTGKLHINLFSAEKTQIHIFNITGKRIISETTENKSHIIDLQNLSKGMYLVEIINKSGIQRKKILIP